MHVLLGTDSARDDLSLDVGGAGQTAALRGYEVEQITVIISRVIRIIFRAAIHAHVLSGEVIFVLWSQVTRVLWRSSRWTGKGSGYHDGGGLRGPAHGAGHVVVIVTAGKFILCTVDKTRPCWRIDGIVKLRRPCETQRVGTAAFLVVLFSSCYSCATK